MLFRSMDFAAKGWLLIDAGSKVGFLRGGRVASSVRPPPEGRDALGKEQWDGEVVAPLRI